MKIWDNFSHWLVTLVYIRRLNEARQFYIPNHDQPIPDRALYFSGCTTLRIINKWKVADLFFCSKNIVFENTTKEQIRNIREKQISVMI